MAFESILYPESLLPGSEPREAPDYFRDFHLDQIVGEITTGFDEYDIAPFYYAPLSDLDAIAYRQEVMRDLEAESVASCIASFAASMRTMRNHLRLAEESIYRYERARWFLEAVQIYCDAVTHLSGELGESGLKSRGLAAFRQHLCGIVESETFRELTRGAAKVATDLADIRYCLFLRDRRVAVLPYDGEPDYTAMVEAIFEKFRGGSVKDYRVGLPESGRLDHVDAEVLEGVARLNPATFAELAAFVAAHAGYLDSAVARFDNEIQFYVAYTAFARRIERSGLSLCYPDLSVESREEEVHDAFDLALPLALASEKRPVVCNDWSLREPERMIVVTGPNQGGKTSFARMFGQLHYLAKLGCSVPGTRARLFLCDRIFVHFEREENVTTLRGKLNEDLVRISDILRRANSNSVVIMNEAFASTTVADALLVSRGVMAKLSRLDLIAVCVTFLDELASYDEKTVSMVGGVDERDATVRTFRIERRPADGMAYAVAIARRYGLTYEAIKSRVR